MVSRLRNPDKEAESHSSYGGGAELGSFLESLRDRSGHCLAHTDNQPPKAVDVDPEAAPRLSCWGSISRAPAPVS